MKLLMSEVLQAFEKSLTAHICLQFENGNHHVRCTFRDDIVGNTEDDLSEKRRLRDSGCSRTSFESICKFTAWSRIPKLRGILLYD